MITSLTKHGKPELPRLHSQAGAWERAEYEIKRHNKLLRHNEIPDQIADIVLDRYGKDQAYDGTGEPDQQDFGGDQTQDFGPAATEQEYSLDFPLPQPQ